MKKLLFIYDKLMTTGEQRLVNIDARFLTFAQINAKMYWFAEREYGKKCRKKKRAFIIPYKGAKVCYGALYEINNWEYVEHKLHSYYYSMQPFVGKVTEDQFFTLEQTTVIPIKFTATSNLSEGNYTRGTRIECEAFMGNLQNRIIKHSTVNYYYKLQGIDHDNFIKLINEIKEI